MLRQALTSSTAAAMGRSTTTASCSWAACRRAYPKRGCAPVPPLYIHILLYHHLHMCACALVPPPYIRTSIYMRPHHAHTTTYMYTRGCAQVPPLALHLAPLHTYNSRAPQSSRSTDQSRTCTCCRPRAAKVAPREPNHRKSKAHTRHAASNSLVSGVCTSDARQSILASS